MADDPRIEPLAEKLRSDYDSAHDASHLAWQDFAGQAVELLAVADAVDPLRALLADEDGAVELLSEAIWHGNPSRVADAGLWSEQGPAVRQVVTGEARAVLAALREVAGL